MEDNLLELEIPKEVANLQLPSPELLDYYKDKNNRIFWLEGVIDDSALELVKIIMRCNLYDSCIPVEKRIPIKIFIDSAGGEVFTAWSIINAIRISKTPVYTYDMCTAYSAAGHILAAGHKRYMFPGATVLVHSASITSAGTMEKTESERKFIQKILSKMNETLISKTKIDSKTMKKKAPFDWYLDENEAIENGIVDGIISDFTELGTYE